MNKDMRKETAAEQNILTLLGSVTLAYYLAWRNIRKISLAEVLRDDTRIGEKIFIQ